jgi:hypothetical protein
VAHVILGVYSSDSVLSRFEQPHAMMVLTISIIPTFAQTTTLILTKVNSHLDRWKINFSHKTQAILNITKDGRLV